MVVNLGLNFLGGPRAGGQLWDMQKHHLTIFKNNIFKGGLSGHQSTAEVNLALWDWFLHSRCSIMVAARPSGGWARG